LIVLVLATAVTGLAAARRCAFQGHEMAGVALAGLTGVLISPVGWVHHMVWVVVAIGALVGDGRVAWRWLAAEGTAWFFIRYDPRQTTRPWPWLARLDPHLVNLLLPDVYGIAAAALAVLLAVLPKAADRDEPARPDPSTPAEPGPAQLPRHSMASGA
jgi:alpha-1,2-mannosyltransferase